MKKISLLILLISFVACSFGANAWATLTGSLSYNNDGLNISTSDTSEHWKKAEFSWIVNENDDGHWNYNYTWTGNVNGGNARDLSHIVIEVSENFTMDNVFNPDPYYSDISDSLEVGNDPTSPGDGIFGLKWNLTSSDDGQEFNFSFDSDRAPMWGDIYAKDGAVQGDKLYATNAMYGQNLTEPDLYALADGNNGGWALVPNTHSSAAPVPEPGTMILVGSGLLGLIGIGRRKFTSKA
ncbi:MAG: PEP-CTERM sorting domain-containing protein [Desulfohalobiaceae bacterium]|nr:PEP-CTERM sorting domain-containing protein [Desulfohalobiaceae bacterium]